MLSYDYYVIIITIIIILIVFIIIIIIIITTIFTWDWSASEFYNATTAQTSTKCIHEKRGRRRILHQYRSRDGALKLLFF